MLRMRMSWEPSQPPRSPRGEGEEGGRNEGWCPLCCDADHLGAFAPSQVNYRGQGEEGWSQTNNPCRSHPLSAARSASPALPPPTGAQQQVPSLPPLPPLLHPGDTPLPPTPFSPPPNSLVLSSRCRAPPVAFQYGHVCWTYSSTLMASANRYLDQGGEEVKDRGARAPRHQSPQAPKCLGAEAPASRHGEGGRGPSTF